MRIERRGKYMVDILFSGTKIDGLSAQVVEEMES